MELHPDRLFEHFAGSALGTFIGDALGMPVEGWSRDSIRRRYGLLSDLKAGRFAPGTYTDDTEMMISILETLVQAGRLDPELAARRFLANFHPERGYGARIYEVMARLAAGAAWDQVATDSFGNGSAMRVAPVGFFFFNDPAGRVEAALAQAAVTHRHSEALAGAVVQAEAVALATQAGLENRPIDAEAFLAVLTARAREIDLNFAEKVAAVADIHPGPLQTVLAQIRGRFRCNVTALEAVPPALAAVLRTSGFRDAVVLAVNLGGDADTIGAMAGAVAGAYYGRSAIPSAWIDRLENGPLGRDYVLDLCRQVAERKAFAAEPGAEGPKRPA